MIYLWPHLREQIDSKKTPEEIYMILKSVTDSRKFFLYSDAEFRGRVDPLNFRIIPTPISYFRNDYAPVLTGNLTEKEGGTAIDVTLQMQESSCIFLTIWNVMNCFIVLFTILAVFTGNLEEKMFIMVPVAFTIGGQVLPRCCFYGSAKKALKRLKELLC